MEPTFDSLPDRNGVEIYDPIEKVRFELYTSREVDPTPADPDEFYYPVDSAVTVETNEIEFPKLASVFVYSAEGEFEEEYHPDDEAASLGSKERYLQLSSTPVILYLMVDGPVSFRRDDTSVRISFDGRTSVRIGARSYHERPEGTITVTGSVEQAMRAISTFGSALKMTTPDRAYPTLRGQPPLVELGDEFHVPESIESPDTGVRLELPLTNEKAFPAASLAYYLGAEVVPSCDGPKLVAGKFEYSLVKDGTYEGTVNRLLQQIMFFDCITRTEGIIKVGLHERNQIEPLIDFDFADIYGKSVPEQLKAYLSVPFETVAEYVPTWGLTTDVTPVAENVEVLPYLAYDLSLIRSTSVSSAKRSISQPELLGDFYRSSLTRGGGTNSASTTITRGASADPEKDRIIRPEPVETTEHVWVGDGFPLGANKLTIDALRRRFEYSAPEKPGISVRVVCNDDSMSNEIVDRLYGVRDLLEYDVSIDYNLCVEELRELLETSADFFHYIGHVDEDGFQCRDGSLDARTLKEVGITAFFLNACSSYKQGNALVEKGSLAGVVTLADIANNTATRVGQTFARLLNCGFPLRTALTLARQQTVSGYQYISLGSGGQKVVQSESGPLLCTYVEPSSDDKYRVNMKTYTDTQYRIGSTYSINILGDTTRYLVLNDVTFKDIHEDELKNCLKLERQPIIINDEFYWELCDFIS